MNYAGAGTDHLGFGRCKHHGGATPNHMSHAIVAAAAARSAAYGEPIETDPMAALLGEVHRTAGHVAWLSSELEQHPDPSTFAARVVMRLYQDERAHLVRVAKAAIDAGVAEHEVRIAEGQGRLLTEIIFNVIGGLALNPRQVIEARTVVARELRRAAELEVSP